MQDVSLSRLGCVCVCVADRGSLSRFWPLKRQTVGGLLDGVNFSDGMMDGTSCCLIGGKLVEGA